MSQKQNNNDGTETQQPSTQETLERTTIEVDGDTVTLQDLMADIAHGHDELDQHKRGAKKAATALEEAIIVAELNGQDRKSGVLQEVKRAAHGLYLRIERGDAELAGRDDGKFSGYFSNTGGDRGEN